MDFDKRQHKPDRESKCAARSEPVPLSLVLLTSKRLVTSCGGRAVELQARAQRRNMAATLSGSRRASSPWPAAASAALHTASWKSARRKEHAQFEENTSGWVVVGQVLASVPRRDPERLDI
jgi:hypothetical protein